MTNQEEWNEFRDNLLINAIERYRKTPEYEYIQKQREEIELMLHSSLTTDQEELVEECLFDISAMAERESEVAYRQGLKDGVWLLKKLGVLA